MASMEAVGSVASMIKILGQFLVLIIFLLEAAKGRFHHHEFVVRASSSPSLMSFFTLYF